jgi:hypothetical protein
VHPNNELDCSFWGHPEAWGQKAGLVRVATFNINNINKRLDNLLAWLAKVEPDVVSLQFLSDFLGPGETVFLRAGAAIPARKKA